MSLPWVRLDSNIASHDKILALLGRKPAGTAYQAAASYMFALGYCGAHGTDGHVSFAALGFVHGTRRTAELLVDVGLWEPNGNGWKIRNYETRQELAVIAEAKRAGLSAAGRKANCVRWHGPDCGCWKDSA